MRIPGRTASAPHSASRGSSRNRYAPTARPDVSVDVMSFAECTATSIRPPSSASSSSLTNTPRAPISPNGLVRSRSPAVVIGTRAISIPGRRSQPAAASAWVSASLLPRVPTRSSIVAEPKEVRERGGVGGAVCAGRRLLHPHGRQVEQLVDNSRGKRFDRQPLGLGEPPETGLSSLELGGAYLLGAGTK